MTLIRTLTITRIITLYNNNNNDNNDNANNDNDNNDSNNNSSAPDLGRFAALPLGSAPKLHTV